MSVTGQIAVSSPGNDVKLFFSTSDISTAVSEAGNGDQITLYAGDYSSTESSQLNNLDSSNGKDEVWVVALPGADLDYSSIDDERLSQISDLNRLVEVDDILSELDQFFPPSTGGDGQTVYYDASNDVLRFTDLMEVDPNSNEIDIQDLLIQDDINFPNEDTSSLLGRLEILEELLPSAPQLNQTTASFGADGNLSFGVSNSVTGVTNHPSKNIGDLFSVSGNDRGIIGNSFSYVSGTLNDDVTSTDNHNADVFGRAEEGTLRIFLNGNELSNVNADLSNSSSIDTITGNPGDTGFNLSASSEVTFVDGTPFSASHQRSGVWQVDTSDLQSGYNTIQIRHYDESSSLISQTSEKVYIYDDEGSSISFSSLGFSSLFRTGSTFLSGVEYNTQATADLDATISNVYLYTYDNESNAISFPVSDGFNISSISIPTPNTEIDNVTLNENVTSENLLFSDDFTAQVQITDPVEITTSAPQFSDFDLLINSGSSSNTDLDQHFDEETRRNASNSNFNSDLSGNWNSSRTLKDSGSVGYNDGLQIVINPSRNGHRLVYPFFDFSSVANGPVGNPDYSTDVSGTRYFYGYFTDNTATSNWSLEIDGSATLVDEGSVSTGTDQVSVAIKLPSETGWMDVNQDFVTGQTSDGDGAYQAVNGNVQSVGSNSDIGITTGIKSSTDSFDKFYYRVTAPENWTGHISRIKINWAV